MVSPDDVQTVSGPGRLTKNWALTLPVEFRRRIEDERLVFWRRGLTIWIDAYDAGDGMSVHERMVADRARMSEDATHIKDVRGEHASALSYRLREPRDEGADVDALYTLMHAPEGRIIVAFYYDTPADLALAETIAASLTYTGAPAA